MMKNFNNNNGNFMNILNKASFSLYGSLKKFFTNVIATKNAQISINFILTSILICYDCSYEI